MWKKQALESIPDAFSSSRNHPKEKEEELKSELYQQIGQLKVELDALEKKLDYSVVYKRALIEPENEKIRVRRQCQLLGLNRSSFYHEPQEEKEENLKCTLRLTHRERVFQESVQ